MLSRWPICGFTLGPIWPIHVGNMLAKCVLSHMGFSCGFIVAPKWVCPYGPPKMLHQDYTGPIYGSTLWPIWVNHVGNMWAKCDLSHEGINWGVVIIIFFHFISSITLYLTVAVRQHCKYKFKCTLVMIINIHDICGGHSVWWTWALF